MRPEAAAIFPPHQNQPSFDTDFTDYTVLDSPRRARRARSLFVVGTTNELELTRMLDARPSSIGRTRPAADQRAFVLKNVDAERFACFATPAGLHLSLVGCAARREAFEERIRWRENGRGFGFTTKERAVKDPFCQKLQEFSLAVPYRCHSSAEFSRISLIRTAGIDVNLIVAVADPAAHRNGRAPNANQVRCSRTCPVWSGFCL